MIVYIVLFPIVPRTDNIVPQVDVDILSSTIPLLTITFQESFFLTNS